MKNRQDNIENKLTLLSSMFNSIKKDIKDICTEYKKEVLSNERKK